MLAISHHLLVQIAAGRAGCTEWFTHYALLGDDIIIADRVVAANYLELMRYLGVTINLSKSFEMDSGTLEFAKRWFHPNLGDLSPMGPGLILAAVRNPRMLSMLIRDSVNRDFIFSSHVVRDLDRILRFLRPTSWVRRMRLPILSSVFGPTGGLWVSASGPLFKAVWIGLFPHQMIDKLNHLTELLFRDMALAQSPPLSGDEQVADLVSNFWNRARLLGPSLLGWISAPLVLCSPAFWVYYDLACRGDEKVSEFLEKSTQYWNQYTLILRDLSSPKRRKFARIEPVREMSIDLTRSTFDSRLLDWNRKVEETMLTYHTALFPSWEKYFHVEEELRLDKEYRDLSRSRNLFRKFYKPIPSHLALVPWGKTPST
jgi:hypothetical protein